jgi:hypothetical protein
MGQSRGYSSGKFALELEGKAAGFLRSVEGGEPFGTVVVDAPGADGIAKKHLASLEFEPITVTFGIGMAKELYNWIAEVCNRQQKPRSGAIVFLNYDFTEVERLEWKNGLITQIVFPALDGGAKDAAFLAITIAPDLVQRTSSSGKAQAGFATKAAQKKLMASNFRFSVSKLESESNRVMRVQGLSITQPVVAGGVGEERIPQRQSGTLQISNVLVTLPLAFGKPWLEWVDDFLVKGNSDDASERTATLQFLDPTMKDALFTVTLSHVGPVRARRQVASSGIDAISLLELELYCESVAFTPGVDAAGSPVSTTSTTQSSTGASPSGSSSTTDTLVALLAASGSIIDAQRALRVLQTSSIASSPELVAARLKATPISVPLATKQRQRADGESLGERWASEHASLEELKTLAPLEAGDWTAIQLGDEHTLVTQLRQAGIVPPGGEGAMQLTRDEFVEGIVTGAARVLRSAQPHLGGD